MSLLSVLPESPRRDPILARTRMSSNPEADHPSADPPMSLLSAEELLPPVEEPSAKFLLQLFVIPAIIVLGVVLLWFLVTTVATRGDRNPEKILAGLRSSNQARWQKADDLASMLRLEQRYPELKRDAKFAGQLAALLAEEVEAGSDDEYSIKFRSFLSRALGEFYVDDGLAVLLETARKDSERDVRREAINAIAVLGHTLGALDPPQMLAHPQLVETLIGLANEQDDLIRSQAAFAIGVFAAQPEADPRWTQELERLVDDLYADARYNAALGLARQGNLCAVEAVAEMLTPDALALTIAGEKQPALQTYKRNMILHNALDAADLLLQKNPQADLSELLDAVQKFVQTAADWNVAGKVPKVLIQRGQALLDQQAQRSAIAPK